MAFYSVLGFLRPALNIFLLPLFLNPKFLSEAEFGMYGLMMDFAFISTIFISLKINTAMLINYYDYVDDGSKLQKYLSSTFTFSLIFGVLVAIIFALVGPSVFKLVYASETLSFFPYGFTVVLFTLITEMNLNYIVFLKNKKNVIRYSIVLLTQILTVAFFQVLFIVVLKRGLQGALEGVLVGNILVTIIVLLLERKIITFNWDLSMIKASLKFSVPLVPYLVIYWFLTKSGKTFLERETDLDTVGIYNLLITLAGLVIFALEAVVNAIRPFLFEAFKRNDKSDGAQVSLLIRLIINAPLLIVPCLILVGTNITVVTENQFYYGIDQYITFACFVMFVFVWARLFYQQMVFTKKSNWVTMLSFIVFVILMFAFYILIPKYQIWGVLISTLIANVVMAILFYFAAQKAYRLHFNFAQIIGIPFVVFSFIFLLEYMFERNGWSMAAYGVTQFFLAIFMIVSLNWHVIKDYKKIFVKSK